jgi:hypothetical protein
MSADAASAAVPGPTEPTGTTPAPGPVTGLLASLVAPVEPARPTFDLTPATASDATPEGGADLPSGGVSSASFHDEDGTDTTTADKTDNTSSSKTQTGIWRAWLIAGANRWGKGGGTANKRLDMHKARAQAQQVKETRTVTVNRTPAGPTGGSSASGPGGKGLSGKSGSGGPTNAPKSTGPAAKNNSRGPGRGAPGGGSGTSGTNNGPATKQQQKPSKTDTTTAPKPSKTSSTDQKTGKTGAGAGGTAGAKGAAGGSGKDKAAPKTPAPTKGATTTPDTKTAGTTAAKTTKDRPDSPERKKTSLIKGDKTTKTDKPAPKADPAAKKTAGGKDTPATADGEKKATGKTAGGEKKPPTAPGKTFTTRDSRDTGFRDGSRLARTTAQAKAYRDGFKDGWVDTTEAAERQKTNLDKAHALRKQQLDQEREQPVTSTSADYHQAQPIEVTGVDEKHVFLGAGAARDSLTRGEVRSLKAAERRLEAKVSLLLKGAEQARTLQAHAGEQGKEATQLLEQARGSKAGGKVIGSLSRTQEDTTAQIRAAEDLYKRAIRGAEQSSAALANVKTRYGGLYTAVVNSPETKPAEMSFYRDGALAHA